MDPFLYNQRNEGLKCLMFHFIVEKIINYGKDGRLMYYLIDNTIKTAVLS